MRSRSSGTRPVRFLLGRRSRRSGVLPTSSCTSPQDPQPPCLLASPCRSAHPYGTSARSPHGPPPSPNDGANERQDGRLHRQQLQAGGTPGFPGGSSRSTSTKPVPQLRSPRAPCLLELRRGGSLCTRVPKAGQDGNHRSRDRV